MNRLDVHPFAELIIARIAIALKIAPIFLK
jgi:hypothetical protein